MKFCVKCGEPKHSNEFHKNKNNADGLKNTCKDCVKIDSSDRYYWKTKSSESYDEFHFDRKGFIKNNFPIVNYSSFSSYLSRKGLKLSDLKKADLIDELSFWIKIKRKS